MERQVKERLVGAAVLIAAAVILIPELLSGPKQTSTAPVSARAGEAPMKTYTIDLNRSPDAPAATTVEAQPPPQESSRPAENPPGPNTAGDSKSAPEPQASLTESAPPTTVTTPARPAAEQAERTQSEPQPSAPRPETKPESAPAKSSTPVPPDKSAAPASVAAAADKQPPMPPKAPPPATLNPLASAAKAPTSKQWAVQLGSFSSKANAERLVKEWEGRGQRGSVSAVQAASGTLYRARLGPFSEREEADATLRKVRASVNGAAIVALP